jgi:hypothetical protein
VLWRELLQDPEHEEERRYTFRALKLSMLRGYNARVLLTALAMLLDKLAHRRRGLRPIRNIAEYYGSLLDVANQDPEKTGGGQEWECRMWTPDQLQRIKRGARPHQVLANPDRVRLAEQEAPPEPMERPPLVTPGVSSQPDLPLSGVADLVRKSRRASPNSVAKSLLERVGGDLEALAEAWMAAGGPSEALSLLEYARAERRAMGLDG